MTTHKVCKVCKGVDFEVRCTMCSEIEPLQPMSDHAKTIIQSARDLRATVAELDGCWLGHTMCLHILDALDNLLLLADVDGGSAPHPELTTPASPKDDPSLMERPGIPAVVDVSGWDVRGYQPREGAVWDKAISIAKGHVCDSCWTSWRQWRMAGGREHDCLQALKIWEELKSQKALAVGRLPGEASLIAKREIVSAPGAAIEVERLTPTDAHRQSVSDALAQGRLPGEEKP